MPFDRYIQSRNENVSLIQLIEHDVSMLISLKELLEENGWMVVASTDPEKAIEQYFELTPDCLIINMDLPNKNGFEILNEICQHNKQNFIPIIMISEVDNLETRIAAYSKGADDFIAKPFILEEFIIRLKRQLQRKQMFDKSSLLDELTQIYNRRFFTEIFSRSISELQRSKGYFSLGILDLDSFKEINDTYGHLVGDEVLFKFGQFIKERIRSTDFVFRYGGEEFVCLFQNCDDKEAVAILSRLLADFREIEFKYGGDSFNVTFSGGVYLINNPSVTMSNAIKMADKALYRAKEEGRARVLSSNVIEPSVGMQTLNVSLVDDDAMVRKMLIKVLQSITLNHFELHIQDFEDGLTFFQSNRLDEPGEHFLILDGSMPVMDGLEILQKVKQSEKKKRITVLMLTARNSENDISRALKLGADDYITKPFSIVELQARIQRLFQRMS